MTNHTEKTIDFVKKELQNAESGHDWWHIQRVHKSAKAIAIEEKVNLEIVGLSTNKFKD